MRKWSLLGVAAVSLLLAGNARDARAENAPDAQLDRLASAGHTLKWNWTPPWRAERYGHAETLVAAPLAAVRAQVTDFPHYRDFAPDKFKNARMVDKEGQNVDMYFQVPIMHGVLMLWYVSRFGPPRVVQPGTEVVEGKFVRGNIKDMHLVMTMRKIDDAHTIVSCDLLLLPNMVAPQSAVDEELRDAAQQAVDAVRDRSQGQKGDIPYARPAAPAQPAQQTASATPQTSGG